MTKSWRRLAAIAIGLGLLTSCYSQMDDGGGGGGGDWMSPSPSPSPVPDAVPWDETLDQPLR